LALARAVVVVVPDAVVVGGARGSVGVLVARDGAAQALRVPEARAITSALGLARSLRAR